MTLSNLEMKAFILTYGSRGKRIHHGRMNGMIANARFGSRSKELRAHISTSRGEQAESRERTESREGYQCGGPTPPVMSFF